MTPEEIQAERNNCKYFTESREGGYILEVKKDFGLEFIEHCNKSKAAFLPTRRWGEFIGDNRVAHLFDPITKYDLISSGYIGLVNGCALYTDAFVSLQAKAEHVLEDVLFVPR